MNILLFTLEYPPFKGGVANYYGNLKKYWSEQNAFFVLDNNRNNLLNNNLVFLKWLPSFRALWTEVKKNKIKHVLVGNILPLGTVAMLLSLFLKIEYSVFIHGTDLAYCQKSFRKKVLAKIILKKSKNIICNSSYVSGLVKSFVKHKNIKVVNPGVENNISVDPRQVERIKNKYNLKNKIVLFSLGRLIKRKGVDMLIKVLPNVLKKIPNLIYIVAGTGPDEECLKKIAKGAENIIFLGKISEKDKSVFLEICDIFIQAAREEKGNFDGFGIVYLEANLAGKPVIAGKSGGVADAVEDGVSGFLINPCSGKEIKDTIVKLVHDENLREKLGKQGRERALEDFNWPRQVKKIWDIVK